MHSIVNVFNMFDFHMSNMYILVSSFLEKNFIFWFLGYVSELVLVSHAGYNALEKCHDDIDKITNLPTSKFDQRCYDWPGLDEEWATPPG